MPVKRFVLLLAASLAFPATASISVPGDPAEAFGVRESIEAIALSPDGRRLTYIQPGSGQGAVLFNVDLEGSRRPRIAALANGEQLRLGGCRYVSNERLICSIHATRRVQGELIGLERLIAIDDDGSDIRVLGERDSEDQLRVRGSSGSVIDFLGEADDAVLLAQEFVPQGFRVTRTNRVRSGMGVVRVNTRGPAVSTIEGPRDDAVQFISDGRGTVRIMATRSSASPITQTRFANQGPPGRGRVVRNADIRPLSGHASDQMNFFYRRVGSDDWQPLGRYDLAHERGLYPVAIDPTRDAAYAFDNMEGDRTLYRIALDGSGHRERVAAPDHLDVDGLIRMGRNGRVIGVRDAIDPGEEVYFDAEIGRLAAQLRQTLPGAPLIRFVDASRDESKLLILASSESNPGTYYLLDRTANSLAEVLSARPELEGMRLAPVRTVSYRAADGTTIAAYLTLPPGVVQRGLPAIVMPNGDTASRGEGGFDWLAQYFANRGYAVLQADFRGVARDSEAWFQENGFSAWRTAVGDINDAGRWLVSEGIADPAKLAVVGWSYGGYAALQAGVVDPGLYRAIVAVAPVTDLSLLSRDWRDPSLDVSNDGSTHGFIGTGPHLAEGSPARHAAAIRAPVLLFHGVLDSNVRITQSRLMRDRLRSAGRQVELVEFPELDQQLEDSDARTQLLRRSDAFLRQALSIG